MRASSDLATKIYNYRLYGYDADLSTKKWFNTCFESKNSSFVYSVQETSDLLNRIFDECAEGKNCNIVPLSGGWDSRAILGALLDRFSNSELEVISFGIRGQLDNDIANLIALKFNLKIHNINLDNVNFSWDEIVKYTGKSPWTYVPDAMFNGLVYEFSNLNYKNLWSGFLGDPLTGSHLLNSELNDLDLAKYFVKSQSRFKLNSYLDDDYFEILKLIENFDGTSQMKFDYIDLLIRQRNCVAPIVLYSRNWEAWSSNIYRSENNCNIQAPFVHYDWANYWLNAPIHIRKDQNHYLRVLNNLYPDLFSLPSKRSIGLNPRHVNMIKLKDFLLRLRSRGDSVFPFLNLKSRAYMNYVDFDKKFRFSRDYQITLKTSVDYLHEERIELNFDFDKMYRDHVRGWSNNSEIFLMIIGLASNIYVESRV